MILCGNKTVGNGKREKGPEQVAPPGRNLAVDGNCGVGLKSIAT